MRSKEEETAYNQAYYKAHRNEIKQRTAVYQTVHMLEISHRNKEKRLKCPDDNKTRCKEYYESHKEHARTYGIDYRKQHVAENCIRREIYNQTHTMEIVCVQCGKHATVPARNSRKLCSSECFAKWMLRENNPAWRGGISFEYCPKFNYALKEEVRRQFERKCFLSGQEESERKHDVHHCDYLKSQGCKGQRWSLLPLEHSWHMKTNHDRWFWFSLLRDYWVYKYLSFHGMDVFEGPDRTTWLWEMYNNGSN
jgi:hypothetical protein